MPTYKTKPFAHQLQAQQRAKDETNFAYFMEMGTGKSKVLLDEIATLHREGRITDVLLLAPKGVYMNWIDQEIPLHLPDDVNAQVFYWSASPTVKERRELEKLRIIRLRQDKRLRILVMNVEAFSSPRGVEFADTFLKASGPCLFAIDESTSIKSHKAKRTKAILKLRALARYRRLLSGNPSTNGPLDLFSQCAFLDPKLLGVPSYFGFRNRYCLLKTQYLGPRSFQVVTGYRNLDELSHKLERFSYRVTKEQCLDLPPKLYQIREVDLTAEQRAAYRQMKGDCYLELQGMGTVTATAVITQMLRLHQIVMGRVPLDDEDTMAHLPSNRMEVLIDTVAELTDPKIIIWATYRADIAGIITALSTVYGKESVVSYWGDTKGKDRPDVIRTFQDPASPVRFFVGNPQVGGWGVNLSQSHTVIYYSNNYNLDHRLQSEARPDRIGQEADHILYIDLMAKGTVDERIVKALRNKLNLSSALLKDPWRDWLV